MDFHWKIKKLKEKKEKNSLVIKKALFCSFCFYFSSNNVKAYAPKSKWIECVQLIKEF